MNDDDNNIPNDSDNNTDDNNNDNSSGLNPPPPPPGDDSNTPPPRYPGGGGGGGSGSGGGGGGDDDGRGISTTRVELINTNPGSNEEFENIIGEIIPDRIPAKYVDHIEITFIGNDISKTEQKLTINKKEIIYPLPLNNTFKGNQDKIQKALKKIKNIQIYVDINQVKIDVDNKINNLLNNIDNNSNK